MDIRAAINLIIEASSNNSSLFEERMDFSRSGKFWYNTKNGETYRVRGHHTLVAFDIPELANVLEATFGEEYPEMVQRTRDAAKSFFAADAQDRDHPYIELHDRVCETLCNAGYIRGINDLMFYVALSSRYERGCRELVESCNPLHLSFDLVDIGRSGQIQAADLDLFVRGRSLKSFAKLDAPSK